MEIVYRGRHHSPERIVAIRMMKRTAFSSAGDVQRILNEANVASQMEHAAVVAFYGTRGCQGEPFITMKFNDGETLSRVLKCDEISRTDAIRKLCVADAHGIVHCHQRLFPTLADRKSRKAWVTDFGLAKILETDASLTAAGDIVGASDS